MLGAMAATPAAEGDLERTLVLGAAAGAACFLSQGLGSASGRWSRSWPSGSSCGAD